jgi:hypothetical protein
MATARTVLLLRRHGASWQTALCECQRQLQLPKPSLLNTQVAPAPLHSPIATPKLISIRFFIANMSALACSAALPTRGTTIVVKNGIGTRSCLLASAQDTRSQTGRGKVLTGLGIIQPAGPACNLTAGRSHRSFMDLRKGRPTLAGDAATTVAEQCLPTAAHL